MNDPQQQAYDSQIGRLVQDFLQIEMKFNTMLPKELEQLQYLLDEVHVGDKKYGSINCHLLYRIIFNLNGESTMTMGELSHALSVPFSTTTRMMDWFVDNGYAQRLSDPEDRRVVRVALTDSGREIYTTIERYLVQRFRQMLSPLTAEEQTTMLTLMEKVVRAFQEKKS